MAASQSAGSDPLALMILLCVKHASDSIRVPDKNKQSVINWAQILGIRCFLPFCYIIPPYTRVFVNAPLFHHVVNCKKTPKRPQPPYLLLPEEAQQGNVYMSLYAYTD